MATEVEPIYRFIGSKIQELRGETLTQRTLGQLLSPPVQRAAIANMENGKQRILLHTLIQMADIFGKRISDLLPPPEKTQSEAFDAVMKELKKKARLSTSEAKKLENAIRSPEAA